MINRKVRKLVHNPRLFFADMFINQKKNRKVEIKKNEWEFMLHNYICSV